MAKPLLLGLLPVLLGLASCGTEMQDDQDTSTAASTAIDAVFAEFDDTTPGCAVAVRDGRGDHHHAQFGMADLDADVPITVDTIFDIGSVSKQLTGGAIAVLVAEGDLALDDDITEFVPELGPLDEVITVGDLLHHTSGLPDYIEFLDAEDDDVTTMDDALDVIASEDGDPVALPGTEFEYSNTNYVLLASIIEQVSGSSMVDFSSTEIFEPLGMDRTVVRDDQGELLDGQAQGYDGSDGDWEPVGSSWRQTGDGAVHATPLELLRWADVLLGDPDEESTLGSTAWLDVMITPGPVADGDDRYGGGIEIVGDGDDLLLQHGGSWIGYSSALVMRPASGVAVAVACNIDGIDAENLAESTLDIWETAS